MTDAKNKLFKKTGMTWYEFIEYNTISELIEKYDGTFEIKLTLGDKKEYIGMDGQE